MSTAPPAPGAPVPAGWGRELRDAISPRTVVLVLGVLLLQLGFIASYVGAFHQAEPRSVPITVVAPTGAPAGTAGRAADALSRIEGTPLEATTASSATDARADLARGETSGVLLLGVGSEDQLLVASAAGASVSTAVTEVVRAADTAQQRTVEIVDAVPLQSGDGRGLTGFYAVTGWIVGGYLLASLLGVARGSRPANPRRAAIRLGATVPYAVLSGLGGALVLDPLTGALTGHFAALWGLGALLVLAAATVTMAFQVLLGVLGIGLTVAVFVVLGGPSAGGAYQWPLLPPLWATIGPLLPNGAGVDALRRTVYLQGHAVTGPLLLVAGWAMAGAVITLVGVHLRSRRAPAAA